MTSSVPLPTLSRHDRWRAVAGIAGPAAFVVTWAVLGATREGYSPVHDPISRLAANGADSAAAMTAGFLAFGAGVGLYAWTLGRRLPGGAGWASATTAAATLAVAALPLDAGVDGGHGVAAGLSYAALATTPLLGARGLTALGHRRAALASGVVGVVVAASLAATAFVPQGVGLFQRVGLTLGDAWIVTTAGWLVSRSRK